MNDSPSRNEKKQKFMDEYIEKQKVQRKKIITAAIVVVSLIVGGIWYVNSKPYTSESGGNYFVENKPSYQGKKVDMTKVSAKQENGKLIIPLSEVTDNNIVQFEFEADDPEHEFYGKVKGKLPIMAFLSTAGRLSVATSVCEPCFGTEFYLQDNHLVCVACGTRWRNTDLFGEMGGCVKYPPEELKYSIEGENLVISEDLLNNWKPRFFTDDVMG